jgi:hypothetical protein
MPTNTRRKRFLVRVEGHANPIDVLAANRQAAIDGLIRRGYKPTHIGLRPKRRRISGEDYRRQIGGGWKTSTAGLHRAKMDLGLKLPVEVKQHNKVGDTNGNYRLSMEGGYLHHQIMVKGYLTADQASKTLWHELGHAAQAEAFVARYEGNPWDAYYAWYRYIDSLKGSTYLDRDIEVDARNQSRRAATIALALPNRS